MMNKYLKCLILAFFMSAFLEGCFFMPPEDIPYLVTDIRVENGRQGEQVIGSLLLTVLNGTEAAMVSLRAEFDVYDVSGNLQPGVGINHVESLCAADIPPGGEAEIRILLDPLFSLPPGENLTVTRFCIFRVDFSDGTFWEDPWRRCLILSSDVGVEEI